MQTQTPKSLIIISIVVFIFAIIIILPTLLYEDESSSLITTNIKEKITGRVTHKKKSGGKYDSWLPMFANVARQLEDAGIKVYNVSPDSAIEEFEKITWEEYLCLVSDR